MPENSCLVIPSNPECYQAHDIPYAYRQDANFLYLTGFQEPESYCIFEKGGEQQYSGFSIIIALLALLFTPPFAGVAHTTNPCEV